jgi:hypothetical protein
MEESALERERERKTNISESTRGFERELESETKLYLVRNVNIGVVA